LLKIKITYAEWEYVVEGWDYNSEYLKGWNLDLIVNLQLNKWDDFKKRILPPMNLAVNHESNDYTEQDLISHNLLVSFNYVSLLASNQKNFLKVLDWGGGIGHYGQIAKSSLPEITIDYWCYDLEAFNKAALKANPDIHFSSDPMFFNKENFDLVNVSSSLWYDQNWKKTIKDLIANIAQYLYITRMIFIENSNTYVAIQRPYSMGYKTEYLCWIFNKQEFVSYIETMGFSLEREFYLGPSAEIFKAPEQGQYLGFLFKKVTNHKDA
jgi:putative methyltransferase (TIGR04325 family)